MTLVKKIENSDFVLVSKSWCKSGGHRKEFVKRSSKVLDRIEDLEGTLIKLSKQLKRMNSIKDGGDIDRIVNSLLPQSEYVYGGFNLILSIDEYVHVKDRNNDYQLQKLKKRIH